MKEADMKIIHCADLHLDSKMETNLSTEQALQRRQEILRTFEKMVDYAMEHEVAVMIIAGDMFDTPQNHQKRIKNRVIDKIRYAKQIDFLYLKGNHDKDSYFTEMENKPDNLKLFSNQWSAYRYQQIVITGKEFDQTNKDDFYAGLTLNENDFNIVVLHGQIFATSQSKAGEIISLASLQDKYIDYLALGHIHSSCYEKLDYRGYYSYSGCLEGRGFDEVGEKGFALLEINEQTCTRTFIPIANRTFHEVKINVTNLNDFYDLKELVEEKIYSISQKDIVKLVLEGEVPEDFELDYTYLKELLREKFYFSKLLDHTVLKMDYLKYENDISLKGEFIRLVHREELDEERKNAIIRTGIKAMLGREFL